MKQFLTLVFFLVLSTVHESVLAQSAAQKRVLVYFKSGVQRNPPPNENTVTISSSNINQVLNTYGLSASNVSVTFPDFNEADTVISEIGEAPGK